MSPTRPVPRYIVPAHHLGSTIYLLFAKNVFVGKTGKVPTKVQPNHNPSMTHIWVATHQLRISGSLIQASSAGLYFNMNKPTDDTEVFVPPNSPVHF